MGGFIKGAGSVLLAVVIALAWPWTNWLKDGKYIGDSGRLIILALLTLVLLVQQTYLVVPNPISFSVVNARRRITEEYLKTFLNLYYDMLPHLGVSEPSPIVRVNVMLVTRKWKGLGGTYLKPYYYSCPNGVLYASEEWELKWKKKNGTAGWAWSNKERTIYDSVDETLRSPGRGLTKRQREVVGNLKSVLSIPILYEGSLVGLLNMDSKENITRTKFNYDGVYTLASQAATIISGQFDSKGVAA